MPRVDAMYASKYLSYKTFTPGDVVAVTVRQIVAEQIRAQGGFNRQGQGGPPPEPDWLMYFEEYQLPFKLRVSRARMLAKLFGEDNTDNWIGRQFQLYRGVTTIGGEAIEGLLIDNRLPPSRQIAAPGALVLRDKMHQRVPEAAVARFTATIGEHGKRWDDFVGWLKDKSREAHDAVVGRALDSVPGGVVPAMKAYLDELHDPPALPASVKTHEAGPYAAVPEDDIPF